MFKDWRKTLRTPVGSKVWIRFDNGFSVRECRLVDQSNGGIRILIDGPYDVASLFSLLMTRNAAPGRRCRVKWRRGQEIGAEFVGPVAGQGGR
jgi:PilZ domain